MKPTKTKLKQQIEIYQIVVSTLIYMVLTATGLGFFVSLASYSVINTMTFRMAIVQSGDLAGYWSFDENNSNIVKNTAPNAATADGQIHYNNASNTWAAGTGPWENTNVAKGSAIKFTGFRSYVMLTKTNSLKDVSNNQISVSYWIYLTKLPSAMVNEYNNPIPFPSIIDKYSIEADGYSRNQTSYQQYFATWTGAANKLVVKWFDTGGGVHDGSPISNFTFTPDELNKWHNVIWVFDGKSSSLYINGNLDNRASANGKMLKPITGVATISQFGSSIDGAVVDEVKIYNKALTGTEINDIYNDSNCSDLNPCIPEASFNFNESSGTLAHNTSYSGDGTAMGGASFTTNALNGSAINFTGANQYVQVNDNPAFNPTNALTVSAWIRLNKTVAEQTYQYIIVDKSDWPNKNGYQLLFNKPYSNNLIFRIFFGTSYTDVTWNASNLKRNIWYHLVGTYDNEFIKLYIDGNLKAVEGLGKPIDVTTNKLYIGGQGTNFFNGAIDEVKIYSRTLNADQVYYLYNSGHCKRYTGINPYNLTGQQHRMLMNFPANLNTEEINSVASSYPWMNPYNMSICDKLFLTQDALNTLEDPNFFPFPLYIH